MLWDEGGTYGGSSGSPVFNNEGLLVGQLSEVQGIVIQEIQKTFMVNFLELLVMLAAILIQLIWSNSNTRNI